MLLDGGVGGAWGSPLGETKEGGGEIHKRLITKVLITDLMTENYSTIRYPVILFF